MGGLQEKPCVKVLCLRGCFLSHPDVLEVPRTVIAWERQGPEFFWKSTGRSAAHF